ncbi:MAG: EVE domain-containing protein [Ignavibacteriaceae bacterium]|nr:EVE domain-containing protein [Ignavibacteriaceae bacterium]
MNYWLFKSEPLAFSIDDLEKSENQTTYWDGIRNYQARNFLRDTAKPGDLGIYYHSNSEPPAAVGTVTVVSEGYPDFTALDPNSDYYDPACTEEKPVWYMVDIKLLKKFKKPVTLPEIKSKDILANCRLVAKGNRLSVFPVTEEEFNEIVRLGE